MAGEKSSGKTITRREFIGAGVGAAAGLAVGGVAGFLARGSIASPVITQTATDLKGTPVRIGSSVPLTGYASGDGEDMMRGYQIAVEEINAAGGIVGRPVEHIALDGAEFQPDIMVNNFKRLITEFKVDAIIGGYQAQGGMEFDTIADGEMIYLHNNVIEANAEMVRNNPDRYWGIFQTASSEYWYSASLPGFLESLEATGLWKPINYTIALINANNPYSAGLTKYLREVIQGTKWSMGLIEEVIAPLTEWGPTLSKIRRDPPGVIWMTDYFPGDNASFTKQFALDPTPSILHLQYGPSVPEFLELAGDAANGATWASTIAVIQDDFGKNYRQKYKEKFNQEAGFSQGGATYDAMRTYWQAASMAGGVEGRRKVAQMLRQITHRGVCGSRKFHPEDQTARPYPHYTKDAAFGMPTLYFQIQNREHITIDPAPFTTGAFQLPPWFR